MSDDQSQANLWAKDQHHQNVLHWRWNALAAIANDCSNLGTHVCDICAIAEQMSWPETKRTTKVAQQDVVDVAASHWVCASESAYESVSPVDGDCARHRNDAAAATTTTTTCAATEICTSMMLMLRMSYESVSSSCHCSDSPYCDVANPCALYPSPSLYLAPVPAPDLCRCRVVDHHVHDHDHVHACARSPCCYLWCDDGDRSASEECE